jgi:multidrug efflux pump subunit AcrA (membrane-fusion protein)
MGHPVPEFENGRSHVANVGSSSSCRGPATISRAEHPSPVAQLAEHPAVNRRVVGSSPTRGACSGTIPLPALSREGERCEGRIKPLMAERNLAKELALLATEVDSLAKALVQKEAERAREAELRERAEADAQDLREQLRQARRRANAAERELAGSNARIESAEHSHEVNERELRARLKQAEETKKVLRHEVEQIERERRALELNLREVLANLRHAGQEADHSRVASRPTADEATLVPPHPADNGW